MTRCVFRPERPIARFYINTKIRKKANNNKYVFYPLPTNYHEQRRFFTHVFVLAPMRFGVSYHHIQRLQSNYSSITTHYTVYTYIYSIYPLQLKRLTLFLKPY